MPCGYGISKSCCFEVYLFVEHDDNDAEDENDDDVNVDHV